MGQSEETKTSHGYTLLSPSPPQTELSLSQMWEETKPEAGAGDFADVLSRKSL